MTFLKCRVILSLTFRLGELNISVLSFCLKKRKTAIRSVIQFLFLERKIAKEIRKGVFSLIGRFIFFSLMKPITFEVISSSVREHPCQVLEDQKLSKIIEKLHNRILVDR